MVLDRHTVRGYLSRTWTGTECDRDGHDGAGFERFEMVQGWISGRCLFLKVVKGWSSGCRRREGFVIFCGKNLGKWHFICQSEIIWACHRIWQRKALQRQSITQGRVS